MTHGAIQRDAQGPDRTCRLGEQETALQTGHGGDSQLSRVRGGNELTAGLAVASRPALSGLVNHREEIVVRHGAGEAQWVAPLRLRLP